jgi:hypothetical protein
MVEIRQLRDAFRSMPVEADRKDEQMPTHS